MPGEWSSALGSDFGRNGVGVGLEGGIGGSVLILGIEVSILVV